MTKIDELAEGIEHAVYQCRLPLSSKTITFVAEVLGGHLKAIGLRWRKLPRGRIAVIVLAVLRHDQWLAGMASGNGVSPSTIRRWVLEVISLPATRAPRLERVLSKLSATGADVVLLDGTLVRTRRRRARRPAQLLGQAQGPWAAVPGAHRRARQPAVDFGRPAGTLQRDHHRPP
ncbi:hypothetical protein [Actinomadura decatromicini]|uniref:hypothetical protein n=1 Tax=Actinomadura decatromicini TaxID=2604572 RepID=UPI001FE65FFE|nr:hypothetical protein [Actinomadura decatromicini]